MPNFKNLFLVKLLLLNKFIIKIFKGLKIILDIPVENRRIKNIRVNITPNIKVFNISVKANILK